MKHTSINYVWEVVSPKNEKFSACISFFCLSLNYFATGSLRITLGVSILRVHKLYVEG